VDNSEVFIDQLPLHGVRKQQGVSKPGFQLHFCALSSSDASSGENWKSSAIENRLVSSLLFDANPNESLPEASTRSLNRSLSSLSAFN